MIRQEPTFQKEGRHEKYGTEATCGKAVKDRGLYLQPAEKRKTRRFWHAAGLCAKEQKAILKVLLLLKKKRVIKRAVEKRRLRLFAEYRRLWKTAALPYGNG